MSRDEQARELLRKHAGCAPHGLGQSVKTTAALRAIIEALRGASGGGVDATAGDREALGELGWIVASADGTWFRCWESSGPAWTADPKMATRYARRIDAESVHAEDEDAWRVIPFDDIEPDHPAENAKSSGEGEAAAVEIEGSIYDGIAAALVRDGKTIAHVIEYRDAVEIAAALARSGKGEG